MHLTKTAIQKICDEGDFSRPVVVVGFGLGEGGVAEEVARRMSPTSRLLIIEGDAEQAAILKERFMHDERVEVFHGLTQDAEKISKQLHIEGVDAVFGGSYLVHADHQTQAKTIIAIKNMLKSEGIFITFSGIATAQPYLKQEFSRIGEKNIWQNFPPVRMSIAKKA